MKRTSLVFLAMLIVPSLALAQLDAQDGKGVQPYGDYDFAGVGAVNVENGNLNLDIKLLSFKQAGRLPELEIHFISDSETWQEVQTSVDLTFIPGGDAYGQPTTSRLVTNFNYTPFDFEPITYDAGASPDNNNLDNYVYYWGVRDWKGTLHLLASTETGGATTDSIDGSGIRAPSGPSSEVYDREGNAYLVPGSPIVKDIFGNQVVNSGSAQTPTVTDSVGRILPIRLTPSSPGCVTNTLPAPPATDTVTLTVCTSNHAVATHFLTEFPNNSFGAAYDYSGTLLLVDSITVANAQPWQFTYNSYGDISSITMPAGGSASFDWESYVVSGFNTSGGTSVLGRRIISKTVNDANGNVAVWHYKYDTAYVGGPTIVTDPAGNDTSHKFDSTVYPFGIEVDSFAGTYTTPTMTGGVCSGQPSAPNLLKTEFTERLPVDTTVNDGRRPDLLPTNTWTYWPSGKMAGKKVVYDFTRTYTDNQYDNLGEPVQTFPYTTGSAIETDEYDYGHCVPGALIRKTSTNFQWQGTDPRYTTSNVLDAVSSTVITNGSQSLAQTVNQYTDPTFWAVPTITTRGIGADQSSTQYYYSSGTGTSGSNPNGTIYQSKDGNGNITSYTYQCNGLFPLNITNPLAQTTKYSYSCDLGRLASIQDPNDVAGNRSGTQYQYTPIGDLMSVSYPDGGGTTIDYHGYETPLNVTTTTIATTPIIRNMVYDGLGRVTQTQLTSDVSTDFTDTTYDLLGRVQSVSNPYRAGDSAYGITSIAYDELGRKKMQCNADNTPTPAKVCNAGASYQHWSYAENIVTFTDEGGSQWKRTTDGLGRLTTVLEPSGSSKSPTLETDYAYSPLGDLISVNQIGASPEVPRPRSFTYDSLSRLVCASNPETETTYVACPTAATSLPAPGTVDYTYDANGNVLSRIDARGITTTYGDYDGLNRLGFKSYSDGVTPSVYYAYDASPFDGSRSPNFIGRLAQVTTKKGSTVLYNYSSVGYDAVGRASGYEECSGTSPCTSAQFQQVGYSYDPAGNPFQIFTAASYGSVMEANQRLFSYDGASHLSSVTAASGTANIQNGVTATLLASPTYAPSGLLTSASLAVDPQTHQPAIGVTRTYDQRLRRISETDTQLPAGLSSSATVTVDVSGAEQSIGGTGTASQATGTIVLSYQSGAQVKGPMPLFVGSSITLPDGFHASFVAPSNSALGVANALAAVLNTASSPVTAVVSSGGTTNSASVTLTTKTTGADQNGPISLRLVSQVTAAASSLAGGTGTTYDTGTVTVAINGINLTTTYSQTSTPLTVVQGLASAINGANLGFDAVAGSPGSLTVTANQTGTADNGLPLSISSASNEPTVFSSPSFTGGSGTFSGGSDSTIYSYAIPSPPTATSGYAPNGNLLSYTDSMNGVAESWNFTANGAGCYDPLNRLTCANATAGGWAGLGLTWTYDSFGNRKTQTVSGSPNTPAPQTEFAKYDASNNHITSATTAPAGFVYDNAGNITNDGVNTYAYDAEGRLCAVLNGNTGIKTGFAYDGLGNRVAKGTISSTSLTCDSSVFTPTTNYLVGLNGEQLDELDALGNPQHSNVYANGQLLATYVYSQSKWLYAFSDWLGTKHVTTDPARTITETCLSLPFGDALNCSGGIDPSEHHFTGKERDAETGFASGNDYFGARYYGSSMGRFLSPDPYGNSVADFSNPQSWNMYSYVLNNPLKYVDPTGLDCAYLNDAGDGIESSDRNSGIGECNSNGGYWVSGMVNQVSVNSNGSYSFGYTNTDANGNISTGVYANYLGPNTDNSLSSAYSAASSLLNDFLTGSGATVRNYDLSTIEGRNILQSKGIQQLNARIKAGCANGQQSGPVNLSSGQAAANIPYDAANSPVGGQVGGYAGGTYTNNGDSTDISFTNVAGAHSFVYHATPDRPSGSTGPGRSIVQNFTLSEPNPCTHP